MAIFEILLHLLKYILYGKYPLAIKRATSDSNRLTGLDSLIGRKTYSIPFFDIETDLICHAEYLFSADYL